MYQQTIGLMGGFGAYATLRFYRRILEAFSSESERNYPHMILDNDFTMPSRTRALLYGEAYGTVVEQMAASMRRLLDMNVDYIILICGTAHAFLPDVYQFVPEAKTRVLDIIDALGEEMGQKKDVDSALIIAAEGTLMKGLYSARLLQYGIRCLEPEEEYFDSLRRMIEGVKQNHVTEALLQDFVCFLDEFGLRDVVLGCTEFPVLTEHALSLLLDKDYRFWDPLEIIIQKLKKTIR